MGRKHEPPIASWECTFPLVRNGYPYISSQCDRLGTNIFRSRLMLKKTYFMRGEEAAELFYDNTFFTRENAAPKRLKKTLFGEGGVQGLEGEAHQLRKALFLSLMSQARIDELIRLVEQHWQFRSAYWESKTSIILLDELHHILCQAACDWCGMPLHKVNTTDMTKKLVLMIEGGASIGTKHWASRRARHLVENVLVDLVNEYREGSHEVDRSLPFAIFADAYDDKGEPLPSPIVAVELLNIIRPIVAVARYMVFAVIALHEHSQCFKKLKNGGSGDYRRHFIQEVRRYYPFFPFLTAQVSTDFRWHGYRFKRGWQAILDIYGTNHDPHRWESPDQFHPERFEQEGNDFHRFAMIPQGGGDHAFQHRCPGEWITLALIDLVIDKFAQQISYDIPIQDLAIDLNVIPARPRSGLIISNIRSINTLQVDVEENS